MIESNFKPGDLIRFIKKYQWSKPALWSSIDGNDKDYLLIVESELFLVISSFETKIAHNRLFKWYSLMSSSGIFGYNSEGYFESVTET